MPLNRITTGNMEVIASGRVIIESRLPVTFNIDDVDITIKFEADPTQGGMISFNFFPRAVVLECLNMDAALGSSNIDVLDLGWVGTAQLYLNLISGLIGAEKTGKRYVDYTFMRTIVR